MAGARLANRADSAKRGGPAPEPLPQFAHLSMAELRDYRAALADEELRVSYWRRIIQARCDVVRASDSRHVGVDNLRSVLAETRSSRHQALVEIGPVDDIPPLPDLTQLWDRTPKPDDAAHNEALAGDLAAAEAQLSERRTALHEHIDDATAELIARYRANPDLCLAILPTDPMGRARTDRQRTTHEAPRGAARGAAARAHGRQV